MDKAVGCIKLQTERSASDEKFIAQKKLQDPDKLYCLTPFASICGAVSAVPAGEEQPSLLKM